MFRFVLGFFSVVVAIIIWEICIDGIAGNIRTDRLARLVPLICLIPTLVAWGVAHTIHTILPRRVFDRVLVSSAKPLLLGILVSCINVAITSVFIAWFNPPVNDMALYGILSAMSTACVVLLCRRRQAGYCRGCGYDISASIDFGRCPECGSELKG